MKGKSFYGWIVDHFKDVPKARGGVAPASALFALWAVEPHIGGLPSGKNLKDMLENPEFMADVINYARLGKVRLYPNYTYNWKA